MLASGGAKASSNSYFVGTHSTRGSAVFGRSRSCHAASKCIGQHEIQRADQRQFITLYLTMYDLGEVRLHALGSHVLPQEVVKSCVEGDDGNVGRIPFVTCSRMSDIA